jgi:hypothetical protein
VGIKISSETKKNNTLAIKYNSYKDKSRLKKKFQADDTCAFYSKTRTLNHMLINL